MLVQRWAVMLWIVSSNGLICTHLPASLTSCAPKCTLCNCKEVWSKAPNCPPGSEVRFQPGRELAQKMCQVHKKMDPQGSLEEPHFCAVPGGVRSPSSNFCLHPRGRRTCLWRGICSEPRCMRLALFGAYRLYRSASTPPPTLTRSCLANCSQKKPVSILRSFSLIKSVFTTRDNKRLAGGRCRTWNLLQLCRAHGLLPGCPQRSNL